METKSCRDHSLAKPRRAGKDDVPAVIQPGQFLQLIDLSLGDTGFQFFRIEFLKRPDVWRKVCSRIVGFFMSAGFDQVYNFTNAAVNSQIDILDTYINRIGIENGQYSLATAVSLLKGVSGGILVFATHIVSRKATGKGVW